MIVLLLLSVLELLELFEDDVVLDELIEDPPLNPSSFGDVEVFKLADTIGALESGSVTSTGVGSTSLFSKTLLVCLF